jgi:hypothetical protein
MNRQTTLNACSHSNPGCCAYSGIHGCMAPPATFHRFYGEHPDSKLDFPFTSDEFFKNLSNGSKLTPDARFDVVFIDGHHLAEQIDRDFSNALKAVEPTGYVVVYDCNPPTEWHARETFTYFDDPDLNHWNATTWKAFVKRRSNPELHACYIDSDWGIGILSRTIPIGKALQPSNVFYEYQAFDRDRKNMLSLVSIEEFKNLVESHLDKVYLKGNTTDRIGSE